MLNVIASCLGSLQINDELFIAFLVKDILAAGTALGRAGHWRDCLDFATHPNSISTYGPVSRSIFSLHS
jgi:hypothetical protein